MSLDDYRANVGVVLFNHQGLVWFGKRANTPEPHCWQFPQGGVDEGEDLAVAALRELEEETGVSSVKFLARTDDWIVYDYPPEVLAGKKKRGRRHRGQKQVWFAYAFTGDESEIRLDAHDQIEFEAWRWGRLEEGPGLIVPFKRAAYEAVASAFAPFAAT